MSTMMIELLAKRVEVLEKQILILTKDKNTEPTKTDKKSKSDAPKTKRTSGWILFQTANREEVKERLTKDAGDEKANPKEVMTELAKMWKALSDEDKTPYNEKAKHMRDEQSSSDTEAEPKKPLKKQKKEKEKEDKPKKKRVSGYILFQKAMRDEAKQSLEEAAEEDEPKIKQSAVLSELGRMWKALSDEEREEWNEKAAEQKASDSEE